MLTIRTLNLHWPRKKAKSYACEWLVLWLFADINDCLPNPCQYGANCTDHVNNYTCTCAAGYSGRNCSISKSHILNLGCSLTTTRHQYQLSLAKYSIQLTVSQCFQFMVTLDKNCNHVSHVCNKSASLTLDRAPCSIFFSDIDDCSSSPCQSNGSCNDQVNDYNCTCTPGYTGKNCTKGESVKVSMIFDFPNGALRSVKQPVKELRVL